MTAETLSNEGRRELLGRVTPHPATVLNGGWLKKVLMWDWHDLALAGYPGWDLDPCGAPPWVELTIRSGVDSSSRDLAVAFDDIAEGHFYYRDWTTSGIPFVKEGEAYRSGFWFQRRADVERFRKLVASREFASEEDETNG